ncbi:MAG: SOS response-associated peptidase family protein [Verrucomicrobiota bacterium]
MGWKKRGSDPGYTEPAAIARLIAEETRLIRPTLPAPVVMPDGSWKSMLWGFRLPIPGKPGSKRTVVNSREDKLSGRTWNASFRERRCLIVASAFYEWTDRAGAKVPLRFERPEGRLLCIAGIWREEEGRGECFSMITTEPNAVLGPVHDRMPAVLDSDQVASYLAGGLQEFGPSRVPLIYTEAENFLRPKNPAKPIQGDLF